MKLADHLPIKYQFDESNPPPVVPESEQNEGHFYASYDHRLWMFYRCWEPPAESIPIQATLMIVHGTVDHSGVYRELAQALNPHGIAVIAMDMRGWGRSDGESMYFHDVDTFVQDVDFLYQKVHEPGSRYEHVTHRFLLGKSLGGLVTAFCAARYPSHWTGLLGLSGGYQVDPKVGMPPPIVVPILNGLGYFLPKIPFKIPFDQHLIVSDEAALNAWRQDELCCKDKLRLGYGITFLAATQNLEETVAKKLDIPMLMMIGDADQVVTLSGHELMIQGNQHTDKQLKTYPGGYHNLLQEPSLKDQVISDIRTWILERCKK